MKASVKSSIYAHGLCHYKFDVKGPTRQIVQESRGAPPQGKTNKTLLLLVYKKRRPCQLSHHKPHLRLSAGKLVAIKNRISSMGIPAAKMLLLAAPVRLATKHQ